MVGDTYMITLSYYHDFNDGIVLSPDTIHNMTTRSKNYLIRAGLIKQVAHGCGFDWYLTVKGMCWLWKAKCNDTRTI